MASRLPKIAVEDLQVGDLVRDGGEFLPVAHIDRGPTSSWVHLERPNGTTYRIRPRNTRELVAKREVV